MEEIDQILFNKFDELAEKGFTDENVRDLYTRISPKEYDRLIEILEGGALAEYPSEISSKVIGFFKSIREKIEEEK